MYSSLLSFGLEHYLLVFFIIGYYIAPIWYKGLQSCLAPGTKCKSKCDEDEDEQWEEDFVDEEPSPRCSQNALVSSFAFDLPSELRGRIAVHCGFRSLAAVGATCTEWQAQLWESKEVWHALANAANLGDCCSNLEHGWQARSAFRRTIFRIDVPRLQTLSMKGRPHAVLDELVSFAGGLMHGDLTDSEFGEYVRIATRALSAHDPGSAHATSAAERLLRAAHRSMYLYTEEQLERLEYAYKSVHQLHALMMASMQNSYENILEDSFWSGDSVARRDAEISDDAESSDSRSQDGYPKENVMQ
jgi:hypothetical protein